MLCGTWGAATVQAVCFSRVRVAAVGINQGSYSAKMAGGMGETVRSSACLVTCAPTIGPQSDEQTCLTM